MPQQNDLSRSLTPFEQAITLVVVIELSKSSWLIAGTVPGIERQPLKKIVPDETELLRVLHRWRDEAVRKGHTVTRIAVAFEAGRDGFWLARWLTGHGIEAHVIHSSSVAVSREHKRAKTDRLDTGMLMRVFLGWLRGERGHCGMVAIPTIEEEDAKRPCRERENLVGERTRIINRLKSNLTRLGIRGFNPQLRKAPKLLESLRTPEDSPIPPNTLDEMPGGTSPVVTMRHSTMSSLRARATIILVLCAPLTSSVRLRNHCVRALSFWNNRKRQASWIRPRRTRALPDFVRPFSRRLEPLSSGAPVSPA
jgi:transposase